jgi:hypothetical protein
MGDRLLVFWYGKWCLSLVSVERSKKWKWKLSYGPTLHTEETLLKILVAVSYHP